MQAYFRAEKAEALLFLAAGVLSVAVAVWAFFISRERFYVGLALPVLVVGLVQLVVGGTVFFRTTQQIADLVSLHAQSPVEFASTELARMLQVMHNFTIYKWIEIAFVVGGVLLLAFRAGGFWQGLGIGLLMQGTLMLSLDIFAERRGQRYQNELHQLAAATTP